jgi:NAD(P)-dependent dehydrogenase (short-subunit alcohol dehydrogenase family)
MPGALVTGAGGGIGLATARRLARFKKKVQAGKWSPKDS